MKWTGLETWMSINRVRVNDLSKLLNVTPGTVTKWRAGDSYPKLEKLILEYIPAMEKFTSNKIKLTELFTWEVK